MQGQDSNTIANQALQLVGNNMPQVSGYAPTFDSSPAGEALALLYTPTVQAVQREFGWDASRRFFALAVTGNAGPYLGGYAYEYRYPAAAVEIWNIGPQIPTDLNDPLPTNWTIGNTLVGGTQTKVIWSDVPSAYAFYNNNVNESCWDPLMQEAVIRMLASKLAVAIAGRPETSALMGQTAQQAVAMNKGRDG